MKKIKLNKKIIKFGKKISDIRNIKQEFFLKNDQLLNSQIKKGEIYKKQKKRKKCKVCEKNLNGKQINIRNIKYIQCKFCFHLNGTYEDSHKFVKTIYSSKSIKYSQKYFEKDKKNYLSRVKNIYEPKVKFLKSSVKNFRDLKILDIGTGSGYFLSALKRCNINNFIGVEVSKEQVKYGKRMLKAQNISENKIVNIPFNFLENFLKEYKNYNCVSFIGVIEHLQEMKKIINLTLKNKNCSLVFMSVPLYSFTSLIESNFPKVFNRHLGGSHTHLFTEKSLKFLFKKFNFVSHSEWWFGQDFNDLYRSMIVMNKKLNNTASNFIFDYFLNLIDDFQIILDKRKMSSEVHIIFRRKK